MDNNTQYAMIAETEMYGPKTERRLIRIGTQSEAEAWAQGYDPDYYPEVKCTRLVRNQPAATHGEALEILYKGNTDPLQDWSLLPDDAQAALIAKGREICTIEIEPGLELAESLACEAVLADPEARADALESVGLWLCCMSEVAPYDDRDYILAKIF
jgi:hypothetical protein